MKLIYFKDLTLKGGFEKYCGMAVFYLPEKFVGNQYLEVLRISVPSQILVPFPASAKI